MRELKCINQLFGVFRAGSVHPCEAPEAEGGTVDGQRAVHSDVWRPGCRQQSERLHASLGERARLAALYHSVHDPHEGLLWDVGRGQESHSFLHQQEVRFDTHVFRDGFVEFHPGQDGLVFLFLELQAAFDAELAQFPSPWIMHGVFPSQVRFCRFVGVFEGHFVHRLIV